MINITDQDRDEIIAIQFGSAIYFGQTAINKAIKLKNFDRIHSRAVFKFMSVLDLSPVWEVYSQYPTLFTLTELKQFSSK